jgi:hypothetical protein
VRNRAVGDDVRSRGRALPPALDERILDLLVERRFGHAEAKKREAKHQTASQRQVVLAQCIVNNAARLQVMDPVDLHDHAILVPAGVEDVPTVPTLTDNLTTRFGEEPLPAAPRDVDLAQGLGSSHEVKKNALDEATPAIATHRQEGETNGVGIRQALLHNHGQDQGGLPIAASPKCRPHCRNLRASARNARRIDLVATPPSSLPNVDRA